MQALEDIVKLLSRLPGIGGKSASRIAYALISGDNEYNAPRREYLLSSRED